MTYVPPTFDSILELLNDTTKTKYQLAADLHAMLQKVSAPSALNIKPKQERKKREAKAVKVSKTLLSDGFVNGTDDHAEGH